MRRGAFAGLTILEPGEPLSLDGGAFVGENPVVTDQWLSQIPAHRHDDSPPLANPTDLPTVVALSSGGHLPSLMTLFATYTLLDGGGGETTHAPFVSITTPAGLGVPPALASGALDTSAGGLLVNTYVYAFTLTDGLGGESELSNAIVIERLPGYASAQAQITGLDLCLAALPGAVGWRMYRATGGSQYALLATGAGASFTDDGSLGVDYATQPPESDTTLQTGSLTITVPVPSGAHAFNIYLAASEAFADPSLFGTFPAASGGIAIPVAGFDVLPGAPPNVSTAVRGAHLIDPDSELLDWHWKRPVADVASLPAGVQGDVRMVIAAGGWYGVLGLTAAVPADWTALGGGGGGGGGAGQYTHTQTTPASTWVVVHNLGIHPTIQVFDTATDEVEGEIHHDSINQITLTFSAPFAGVAYCN